MLGASGGLASTNAQHCSKGTESCRARPRITNASATPIGGYREYESTLSATIDPNGSQTTYEIWIRYERHLCEGKVPSCTKHTSEPIDSASLAAGDGAELVGYTGNTRDCAYEYWFVASNSAGTVHSPHKNAKNDC